MGYLQVNGRLFVAKMHYFFFFASIACVLPYLPVIAKDYGIPPYLAGLVFMIGRFLGFLVETVAGALADKYQQKRNIIFVGAVVMTVSFFSINFIPPPSHQTLTTTHPNKTPTFIPQPMGYPVYPNLMFTNSNPMLQILFPGNDSEMNLQRFFKKFVESDTRAFFVEQRESPWRTHFTNQIKWDFSALRTSQFWWLTLAGTAGIALGLDCVIAVTDPMVYDMLGSNYNKFGHQRVFGTLGWGLFSLISGICNDYGSSADAYSNYSPGFILFLILMLFDCFTIWHLDVKLQPKSKAVANTFFKTLLKPRAVIFYSSVNFLGAMYGVHQTLQPRYLSELGATNTLLGLNPTVQSLASEVPFFVAAGWFMDRLGATHIITLGYLAWGARFIGYSMLSEPWDVLPMEMLHGCTSLVVPAALHHSVSLAPPQIATTVMGFVGGIYFGLGMAMGCLIGGFLYESYGGAATFYILGFSSFFLAILYAVGQIILKSKIKPKQNSVYFKDPIAELITDITSSKYKLQNEVIVY